MNVWWQIVVKVYVMPKSFEVAHSLIHLLDLVNNLSLGILVFLLLRLDIFWKLLLSLFDELFILFLQLLCFRILIIFKRFVSLNKLSMLFLQPLVPLDFSADLTNFGLESIDIVLVIADHVLYVQLTILVVRIVLTLQQILQLLVGIFQRFLYLVLLSLNIL